MFLSKVGKIQYIRGKLIHVYDPALERGIAQKFEDIADVGWFPTDVPESFAQLQALKSFLEPLANKRVLDAGCARGRFVRHLTQSGAQVTGIDLTEVFVQSAKTNVPRATFARATLSSLPFPDNTFDAVYCIEVLQHLPDTKLALSEMVRVLKPGGTLVVIDKSLQGLDPGNGLPNWYVKPKAEREGRWMYPADFPFRERWFWPRALAGQLRPLVSKVKFHYIPEGRGKASKLYRLLPFLSLDVAWVGRK